MSSWLSSGGRVAALLSLLALLSIPSYGALAITSGSSFGPVQVGPAEFPLQASGAPGPYTWSIVSGSLPPGMALRADGPFPGWFPADASSDLAGVATLPGTYNFTLQVSNGSATAQMACTMVVASFTVTTPVQFPDGFIGVAVNQSLTATGSGTTWTLPSYASLPPGLILSPSGTLYGSPTATGFYSFDLQATQGGVTVTRRMQLNVYGVRMTSGSLPNATVGVAYSTHLAADYGTPPYNWTPIGVPGGLTLATDGTISGMPNQPGNSWFSVSVSDSAGHTYTRSVSLCIIGTPPVLPQMSGGAFGGTTLYDTVVGNPYQMLFSMSGGTAPYTWSAAGLPAWLSIRSSQFNWNDPSGAELVGTPPAAGTYTFTISAVDSSAVPVTVTRQFTLRVASITLSNWPSFTGTMGSPYSALLRTMGGTAPYTWALAGFPAGLAVDAATGLLSGTPIENGSFGPNLTISDSAGNVNVIYLGFNVASGFSPDNQIYNSQPVVGSVGQNYWWSPGATIGFNSWGIVSGALPPGLTVDGTGAITGTPTTIGTYTFLLRGWNAATSANYAQRQFTISVSPVHINSINANWANLGASYNGSFVMAGGTGSYTFTLLPDSCLPPGITMTSAGALVGSATASGRYWYHVSVTDGSGQPAFAFSGVIDIYPPGTFPPVQIQMGSDWGTSSLGIYDFYLWSAGGNGTVTWTLTGGSLPPGLALRTDFFNTPPANVTGLLAGVATTPGTYTFTLTAASGSSSDTRTFTWRFTGLNNKDPNLPDAFVSVPYNYKLSAVGATGAVTFGLQTGTATPTWVAVAPDGTISGTPSTPVNNTQVCYSITDTTATVNRCLNLRVSAIRVYNVSSIAQRHSEWRIRSGNPVRDRRVRTLYLDRTLLFARRADPEPFGCHLRHHAGRPRFLHLHHHRE